jgi:molybdopterin/thiamine biosynthesis adenylyltransferase
MRYSRQEQVKQLGKQGQQTIHDTTILILGVGGLGSICAELLSRAGIGKLILVDHDRVELSNLQRQGLFTENDIHRFKVDAAKDKIKQINNDVKCMTLNIFLNSKTIELFEKEAYAFDIAIDCTDNLYTRFLMNDYCKKYNIPLIFGTTASTKGMVMAITKETACFNCIFENKISFEDCERSGILNTTNHIVASVQVNTLLQVLLEKKRESRLIIINSWNATIDKIKVEKRKGCEVCHKKFYYLDGKKQYVVGYCKTKDTYAVDFGLQVYEKIEKMPDVFVLEKTDEYLKIIYKNTTIVVHQYGRMEFFTKNKTLIDEFMHTILKA